MNQRKGSTQFAFRAVLLAAFASSFLFQPLIFASSWFLTTADFQTRQVDLQAVGDDGVKYAAASGQSQQIEPMSNVLQLSHDVPAAANAGIFVLSLSSGDRVMGKPIALGGETLTWDNPLVGKLAVPLREVRMLTKSSSMRGATDQPPPSEDTLALTNGDVVKGIVARLGDGKITVAQQGGDNVEVPLESLATAVFAAPARGPASAPARAFRVRLGDGSTITAQGVSLSGDNAQLKLSDGADRSVPASAIALIEQVNGPVMFLSSLHPTEEVQKPYLGAPWPTQFDRTVTGQPLPAHFTHGIGVHSYSRLTYDLDPAAGYRQFRTQFAIDGGGPYANVTVRVLVDGKPAFEQKNVTSTDPSGVVRVPVDGAKTLTLEVDYGLSNDTQDRFLWLDPALVRDAVK